MFDNNHGFGGFPWPFMMPNGNSTVIQRSENKVPPVRVQVAMAYLRHLTSKTQAGAVPHGMGAVEIDGQKLVPAETAAQTAACELLKNYFKGDLPPTVWEEKDKEDDTEGKTGRLVGCPFCRGKDISCVFCEGRGNLLIYAVGTTNEEG